MAVDHAQASKTEDLLGKEVMARITRPRNLEFHKKYFALLKTSLDMADVQMNLDQWRWLVLTGIGHCDFFIGPNGYPVAVPKSISFAAMDDIEFEGIYARSLDFICENYLDDEPAHLRQVLEFL